MVKGMKKLWMTVLLVFLVGLTVPLSAKADEKKPVLMWTNMYLHEGKFSPLDNLKDKRTEWRSTDPSVVEVYPNGNVLAKMQGTAVIIATLEGEEYYCKIRVGDKPYREWENIVTEPKFTIYKGILFDYAGNNAEVVVPDGVHTIREEAFAYCTETLEKVVLPDSVTTIEAEAFANCTKLKEVQFGQGLKSIGGHAFYRCENLEVISSLSNVEWISANAFWQCDKLADIGSLDSLKGIGAGAFASTPWLEAQLAENDSMLICNGILIDGKQCAGAVKIPNTVKIIAPGAFSFNTKIESVEIPESVTIIGSGAFTCCYKLKSISMADSVQVIEGGAFEQCIRLKNIRLSNGLQKIGNQAFRQCKRLYNISIPESLTELGEDIFMFCEGMKFVTISPDMETKLCTQLLEEIKDKCKDTVKIYTITEELRPEVRDIIEASGLQLCDLELLEDGVQLRRGEVFEQRLESRAKASWKSEDTSVATVNKYGRIIARGKGSTVVTVTIYGKEYSCTVTVQ